MISKIRITEQYEPLRKQLENLPQAFTGGQGSLLYDGRNQIRLFTLSGHKVVVKRFKRHNFLKQLIYTFFRTNKACRAFNNAQTLLAKGYDTPRPIACWEERRMGLVTQVYYACEHTEAEPIRPRLIEQEPFDEQLATAYARFVASLHETGILHRDLNPTNVLFSRQERVGDGLSFQLIDINRMRFYDGPVPKAECMENLTLFWWLTDVYRFVLRQYADTRGWSKSDINEAIRVKQRHDRRWIRRKNSTAFFKNLTRKHKI